MYLQVALFSAPYTSLTYAAAEGFEDSFWSPGMRVAIPLGRGKDSVRTGCILEVFATNPLPKAIHIKPVLWPLERVALLRADLVELIKELSRRLGVEEGRVVNTFLPQVFKESALLLQMGFGNAAKTYSLAELNRLAGDERSALIAAFCAGQATMVRENKRRAQEEYYSLNCDPPWPVRPMARVQIAVLEYLHNHGSAQRKVLTKAISASLSQALNSLLKAELITVGGGPEKELEASALLPPKSCPFQLTVAQQSCVDALLQVLARHTFQATLLHGVTGSGKTAVYLELAVACLRLGRSVLLLVPEVALALKLLQDCSTMYPDVQVVCFHGYQTPAQKKKIWALAREEKPCFILGTRSALFLPVFDLGCIILDEEHDASFKQDEGLIYHAKEIAWFRAQRTNALLLLGSATPDIRVYHAAKEGKIPLLCLPNRLSGQALPPIELIDTHDSATLSTNVPQLSCVSMKAIEETIERKEQVVILINRRGFAPHLYCLDCGKTERCPSCAIALTYHKARGRLVCHYCGYSVPFPAPCSTCGGASFLPMGEGTERLAEELATTLQIPVLRLDRDSTSRPGQMEKILTSFARQESLILVGTQMLSKGHHFPKVTLVIAADADMGLNFPDYRAAERTFQLMVQSAGRAGRGEIKGHVLLQTRDISHYCWKYVQLSDYEGFYAEELARRKRHAYPPFVKLALLRISYHKEDATSAEQELLFLGQILREEAPKLGLKLLGPAPAPLAMLRNRLRFQCIIKAMEWSSVRELFQRAQGRSRPRHLRLALDLDPVNML